MNEELEKQLKIAAIVVASPVLLYYIASPYQNGLRDSESASFCARSTRW